MTAISTQRRKEAKTQEKSRNRLQQLFLIPLNFATLRLCVFALIFSLPVAAQKVAVLTPDRSDASRAFAEKLEAKLAGKFTVVDGSMSEAAFAAADIETPFNLTIAQSQTVGQAIGCDVFILAKSDTLRRSSTKQIEYYESYAAIYVVSSRTGRLVFWKLQKFEATTAQNAQKPLNDSVDDMAFEIVEKARSVVKSELTEPAAPQMEEPPQEGTRATKNFRAPIPYRRVKPEYTADAFLYGVEATVEIIVDLDAKGRILRTQIVRWAGYGLDDSVEKTVRAMTWRPAERNGKALPMRFLLRYNFRKPL